MAYKGFIFHKKSCSKNRVYWTCSKRPYCKGRAVTTSSTGSDMRIVKYSEHNHLPFRNFFIGSEFIF